ncbi:endonuclease-reverse transcriptase domain-containing protein [Phthorimaea operculella]|nr:endonuclease-reverse transcriptase domain-containing protein [Phthorimaea operculella]
MSKRSGGVAIYAINSSNFVTFKLNTSYNKKKEAWECLWLDVKIGNTKFLLCGVYRGHDSTVDQDNIVLEELKLASETQTVVIMGDFNYNGVKWPLLNCGYLTPREDNFVQWFNSSIFEQLVDKHTRYRDGNQPSTLDLILTNDDALIAHVKGLSSAPEKSLSWPKICISCYYRGTVLFIWLVRLLLQLEKQ